MAESRLYSRRNKPRPFLYSVGTDNLKLKTPRYLDKEPAYAEARSTLSINRGYYSTLGGTPTSTPDLSLPRCLKRGFTTKSWFLS